MRTYTCPHSPMHNQVRFSDFTTTEIYISLRFGVAIAPLVFPFMVKLMALKRDVNIQLYLHGQSINHSPLRSRGKSSYLAPFGSSSLLGLPNKHHEVRTHSQRFNLIGYHFARLATCQDHANQMDKTPVDLTKNVPDICYQYRDS